MMHHFLLSEILQSLRKALAFALFLKLSLMSSTRWRRLIVRSSAGPARPVGVSPIGFAWFFLAAPRRWLSNQPTPAVDRQYGPGDESIAHQEDHCRGHLFRAADTPDRQRGPAREDRFALGAE